MLYPLFETLAMVDGVPQNLAYHQQRYQNSLSIFYPNQPATLFDLSEIITLEFTKFLQNSKLESPPSFLRCRVDYKANAYHIGFFDYSKKSYRHFQPIICDTLEYQLKFANRQIFADLLAQKGNADEVMIIKSGVVTDCTIGNLVFKRQGEWFTPTTPLLQGTQRAKLLDEQIISERVIRLQEIDIFEEIRLINALNGMTDER